MGYTTGDPVKDDVDDIWATNMYLPPNIGKMWIEFFKQNFNKTTD